MKNQERNGKLSLDSIVGISRQNFVSPEMVVETSTGIEIFDCPRSIPIDVSNLFVLSTDATETYFRNAEYLSNQLKTNLSEQQLVSIATELQCMPFRGENTRVDSSLVLECIVDRVCFYPWKYETFYVSDIFLCIGYVK